MENWYIPYQTAALPAAQKVWVLAPHPDDEVLVVHVRHHARVRVVDILHAVAVEALVDGLELARLVRGPRDARLVQARGGRGGRRGGRRREQEGVVEHRVGHEAARVQHLVRLRVHAQRVAVDQAVRRRADEPLQLQVVARLDVAAVVLVEVRQLVVDEERSSSLLIQRTSEFEASRCRPLHNNPNYSTFTS